ncbi:unnamed protein product [Kluyveromyces dobzhanskii CBS 2104]|uniref:WGS project CCBQ000000000 data, contig 00058 n=1 Tax=Kluyveromyces dobzhanskii CBS 2104 TaxID=1427455 RepID=A0A0A8LBK0_9SACH|nr:unnamed protein product [Kluyveromyces dobzhanskii CBS 2104]
MFGSRKSHSSLSISQQRLLSHSMSGLSLQNEIKMVYYVGVDVGTGSARACVTDSLGNILSLAERPIQRHELKPNYITQSSHEIWSAICYCVQSVVRDSGVDPKTIHGIGFDATCSLVVVDNDNEDVAVGPDFSDSLQNIILWMDHRAIKETEEINATNDKCLKYVGGQMSVEMEIPKIKWLKNNIPAEKFAQCKFFDLADYLTFKATGSEIRSYCSTVCKQGLLPLGVEGSKHGWSKEFLQEIGLEELTEDDFSKLGGSVTNTTFLSAGECIGTLDETSAAELGLSTHCVVGSGVIDAYAGWVGTVAARTDVEIPSLVKADEQKSGIDRATGRLAAVAGTSTCHIAMSKDPIFVDGVWGPYRDVMAHGFWLAEGGQSCTGALLAHVMTTHPAYAELSQLSDAANVSKFDYLNSRLELLAQQRKVPSVVALAKHLFFYGDYHGNRSPIADPSMRAAIIGQSMDNSIDDLAIMYLGACEFIAQQTRQIVEKMCNSGHEIGTIFMSGGQCRNGLLMRLLADCTGLPIVIPRYIDAAVVFGSALLGAVASESFNACAKLPAVTDAATTSNKDVSIRRKSSLSMKDIETATGNLSNSGSAHGASGFKPLTKFSKLNKKTNDLKVADLPSPYTAPSATSSTAQISTTGGGYPFPIMPNNEEAVIDEIDENEDDDSLLTFNTKAGKSKDAAHSAAHHSNAKILRDVTKDKLWEVMYNMTGGGKVVWPAEKDAPDRKLLNVKYKVFLDMADSQRKYRNLVDSME